mmetsp:Transcript_75061/g.210606  ORF Transcript_75061/g.210606 Transcript_75061/m.210606 type:complete len:767 (-) Transcript_75061:39-2339(-)
MGGLESVTRVSPQASESMQGLRSILSLPPRGQEYARLPTTDVPARAEGSTHPTTHGTADTEETGKKRRLTCRFEPSYVSHEEPKVAVPLAQALLESQAFQFFMGSLILINALTMGLETDMPSWVGWPYIEHLFLIIFSIELSLRVYVSGRSFVDMANPDVVWNLFDTFIVALGLVDELLAVLLSKSTGGVATLFRVVRLLRIMRLFRIIKFLKQLYLLAFGFVDAVHAVFWVTILMTVVLYVCAIVMVRMCGQLPDDDPYHQFLHRHFADIRTSMLTLFVLMSSPNMPMYMDEGNLLADKPLLALFLITFIIIGSFGMIALLTGVISESMFEKNQLRMEESRKDLEKLSKDLEHSAVQIFDTLPKNEKGEATVKDVSLKAIPLVEKMFEAAVIEFTENNLLDLVGIMDLNGTGSIDQEEFTHAICTYASGLKPLSIQEVNFNICMVSHKLGQVQDQLSVISSHVGGGRAMMELEATAAAEMEKLSAVARLQGMQGFRSPKQKASRSRFASGVSDATGDRSRQVTEDWKTSRRPSIADSSMLNDAALAVQAARSDVSLLHGTQQEGDPLAEVGGTLNLPPQAVTPSPAWLLAELDRCLRERADEQLKHQESQARSSLEDLRQRLREDVRVMLRDLAAPPLAGGLFVGERVRALVDLDSEFGVVRRGDAGVVRGPSTCGDRGRVNVDFLGLASANVMPRQLCRVAATDAAAATNSVAAPTGGSRPPSPGLHVLLPWAPPADMLDFKVSADTLGSTGSPHMPSAAKLAF